MWSGHLSTATWLTVVRRATPHHNTRRSVKGIGGPAGWMGQPMVLPHVLLLLAPQPATGTLVCAHTPQCAWRTWGRHGTQGQLPSRPAVEAHPPAHLWKHGNMEERQK